MLASIITAEELAFLTKQNETHNYLIESFSKAAAIAPENRFEYGLQCLRELPRRGYVIRGVPPEDNENVYDHTIEMCDIARQFHSVAFGMMPDPRYSEDVALTELIKMITVHDLGEALIKDFSPLDKLDKSIKRRLEALALKVLLQNDPEDLIGRFNEFEDASSPLAQWGCDLDKIQMMYKVMEYQIRYPKLRDNMRNFWTNLPPQKMLTPLGTAIITSLHRQNQRLRPQSRCTNEFSPGWNRTSVQSP